MTLNSGARLYEPQHIPMQSKPLRIADPRSENKSGHYRPLPQLDHGRERPYAQLMLNTGGKKKRKAIMLGVGLDSDGHKRLTTGPNFVLAGGTEDTHEQMTEKAIKINEKLKERGKQLESVSHEEFDDIAREVGLKPVKPRAK
ncbi:MAG: hypothetical protein ABSE16_16295 [Verrucomicrobiota bacterium]